MPDQSDTKEQEQEPEPEQEQDAEHTHIERVSAPAPGASLQGKQDADEAVAVITLFDTEIAHLWGSARAWPASADLTTARRWITPGADAQLVANVVRAVLGRKHTRGEKPPTSLSYADTAITDALTKRSDGAPARNGGSRYKRQSTEAEVAEALAEKAEHEHRLRVVPKSGGTAA